jgi:hypothetical protein
MVLIGKHSLPIRTSFWTWSGLRRLTCSIALGNVVMAALITKSGMKATYEPYIIYKKEGTPWCDERFIGYGANKAACLYEIYLSGIDYWILPDDFLIHQTHFYLEDTRKKEVSITCCRLLRYLPCAIPNILPFQRKYNKKLYDNFREEVCLRYSRMMIANNLWSTPRADNVKAECSKIKGFKSAVGNLN